MGPVKLGTVSLGGTKLKAQLSKDKALSWEYANRCRSRCLAQIRTALATAPPRSDDAGGAPIPVHLALSALPARTPARRLPAAAATPSQARPSARSKEADVHD